MTTLIIHMSKTNQRERICNLAGVPANASVQDLVRLGKNASTNILQNVRDCKLRARLNGGPISAECFDCSSVVTRDVVEAQRVAQRVSLKLALE